METLLTAEQEALLEAERNLLARLHGVLERTGVEESLRQRLAEVVETLDAFFVVVVVGEFNAGKSSLLNALFGERLLEEGPIPTTDRITILRYGEEPLERRRSPFLVERFHPSERLRHMVLVDTPGTNSIIRQHQELTEQFIPRADLVIFVTSFDRPLAESERQFLTYIRDTWGKRLVFVLNKADMARSEADLEQVLAYIREGCRALMGFEPQIFPVSAALAFEARTTNDPERRRQLWEASRFEAFERFLVEHLAGPERLRIKLMTPLELVERLLERIRIHVAERSRLLEEDRANIARLEARLEEVHAHLRETFQPYLTEIDNRLLQVERRGVQFLEDTLRIGRIGLLRDRERFREAFVREVVRDLDRQLEASLQEAVDRLLQQGLQLWNQTLSEFHVRMEAVVRRQPSQIRADLLYDRRQLFESVMREASRQLASYDLEAEGRRILEHTRDAVALFLGTEALAGLGALVIKLITAAGLDVTGGFVAAGALALVGLIVLPVQKRRVLKAFRDRMEALRAELLRALEGQLEREVRRLLERLSESMAPYRAFVQREQQLLDEVRTEMQAIEEEYRRLRTAIERMLPAQ